MTRLLVLFALAGALPVFAQLSKISPARAGFDEKRLESLHETTKRFVDEGQHAGIITLLARDGKVADLQSYGHRDVTRKLPMERDTICRVYSMSKIVTSVGVLCLLEDGRFNLDDPVADYLPELKNLKVMTGGTADAPQLESPKRPVTIKHLLTHTSGLMYDFMAADETGKIYKRAELWRDPSLKVFTEKVGKLPLKHHPGDAFTYGINTDVLGALIERVSGKPLGDFLKERIFHPLKMIDTSFDVPPEKTNRLAITYKHVSGGKGFVEAEPIIGVLPEPGRDLQTGGAGLFSTIGDYGRFAQMLCNYGTLDGKRVLGRKTVELMTANHLTTLTNGTRSIDGGNKGFGLGVEVNLDPGSGAMLASPGQYGWYGAATTYCQIDPRERLVAVAFVQHFPFNEHKFFSKFATGYYQALK